MKHIHLTEKMAERLHRVRLRRLALGATLIAVGSLLPDFHPHFACILASDSLKTIGYTPIIKLVEEFIV